MANQLCLTCGEENSEGTTFCAVCGDTFAAAPRWTQLRYWRNRELPHSRLGIASAAVSVILGICLLLTWLSLMGVRAGLWPIVADVGALLLLVSTGTGMLIVPLVLGIAGLAQEGRNRLFAVLGTVFSTVVLLGASWLLSTIWLW